MRKSVYLFLAGCGAMLLLSACGNNDEANAKAPAEPVKKAQRTAPVSVAGAIRQPVEELETSVGRLEAVSAPAVSAEVGGRIARILVDEGDRVKAGDVLAELDPTDFSIGLKASEAEVKRLKALLDNQARTVRRYRKLRREGTISDDALESADSQLKALREQLAAAKTQRDLAEHNLGKTRIVAPKPGQIDERSVSVGDYVNPGVPAFRLADDSRLRVVLPFPEQAAGRIRPGLTVRLEVVGEIGGTLETTIAAVRPMVDPDNNALHAIAYIDNPGGWKPGASVDAAVVIARREDAVMVPAVSLVRRPAGTVVYVIENDKASQKPVHVGVYRSGMVEIADGLNGSETVAVDGAAFLTNGALVEIREGSS